MRICFWHSDKPRERILAEAFIEGLQHHKGDFGYMRPLLPEVEVASDADVICMVGVKSRELYRAHWRAGCHTVYFDKGYTRHSVVGGVRGWEYWRVAVDGHHPTAHLPGMAYGPDRMDRLGLQWNEWREEGRHVVFAGSSAKYHDFYDLPPPTDFAKKQVRRIHGQSRREIWYRPKPSWKDAEPIEGTIWKQAGSIEDCLRGAHALVTHGSNAVWEAILYGIPCIVLGDAVAKHISSQDIEEIESPRLATWDERKQWASNLAYCQWTLSELASGEAWRHIRPLIYG